MPATHEKVWLTSGPTSRRLGVSRNLLDKLASEGRIRTMKLPGVGAIRYWAADVDRLVAECSTPGREESHLAVQN